MAFSSDTGYYFGEESDPSYESDAPPSPLQYYPPLPEQNFDHPHSSEPTVTYPFSPEPTVLASLLPPDYCRSRSLLRSLEHIPKISKSDGNNSDAEWEETLAVMLRRKRATKRSSKSATTTNGGKSTPSKRSFPSPNASDDEAPQAKRRGSKHVWSEEDEVKLLNKMVELKKSGKEPIADLELFYQVHRFVRSDCTHTQLIGKVRQLKCKYIKIKETARREGEAPIFPTTNDERLYDLSKVVWGVSVRGEDWPGNGRLNPSAYGRKRVRGAGNGGDEEAQNKLVEFCLKCNGSLSEDVLRHGVSVMASGKVEELDKLYKQVRPKEMEVEMMKASLLTEILEEVCNATR